MINILVFAIVIGIITYLVINIIIYIVEKISRGNKKVRHIIYFILITYLCLRLCIGPYPQPDITTTIDSQEYQFKYNNSVLLQNVKNWYALGEKGFVYIERFDIIDNKQIRLYYRTVNFLNSGLMYEEEVSIIDNYGNGYKAKDGGQNTRFFLTGGIRCFNITDDIKFIEINKLIIGEDEIILNKE